MRFRKIATAAALGCALAFSTASSAAGVRAPAAPVIAGADVKGDGLFGGIPFIVGLMGAAIVGGIVFVTVDNSTSP